MTHRHPVPAEWRRVLDPRPANRHVSAMMIYKIFRAREWAELQTNGATSGAPVDLADGYIHFSTAAQAADTAAKHFSGEDGLMLAAVNTHDLGTDLRWEPSRGGQLFPHLYRALDLKDVIWAKPLELTPKGHIFPKDMV